MPQVGAQSYFDGKKTRMKKVRKLKSLQFEKVKKPRRGINLKVPPKSCFRAAADHSGQNFFFIESFKDPSVLFLLHPLQVPSFIPPLRKL